MYIRVYSRITSITAVGMGPIATTVYKRIASLIETRTVFYHSLLVAMQTEIFLISLSNHVPSRNQVISFPLTTPFYSFGQCRGKGPLNNFSFGLVFIIYLISKRGGDAISRHNKLRDVVLQTCHRACISAKAEAGSGLGHELRNTRPADILASNWLCGKPAAFDLTVVSPLNPTFISEAGRTAGSAAVAAELRKHFANDAKCSELGWTCIPLVAESYGAWGSEAVQAFSRLASYLATRTNSPKSKVVCSLYGRLNLTLVRANARALLLRCGCSLQEGDISSS